MGFAIVLASVVSHDGFAEMDSYFERRPDGRIECRFGPGEEQLARDFLALGPQQEPFEVPPRGDWTKLSIGTGLCFLLTSPFFGYALGDELSESLVAGLVLATSSTAVMALLGLLLGRELVVNPAERRLKCGATVSFEDLGVPRRTAREVEAYDPPRRVWSEHVLLARDDVVTVPIGHNAVSQADEVASRVNEVLFEFEERRAIRAWLMQRERELADLGPYRRSTPNASASANER